MTCIKSARFRDKIFLLLDFIIDIGGDIKSERSQRFPLYMSQTHVAHKVLMWSWKAHLKAFKNYGIRKAYKKLGVT